MSLLNLPLHQSPLAFVDVETTGLRPDLGDRMVEIAILRTQGLEKLEEFSSLINPQRPLEHGAMRVNGITPVMVANAPTFAQLLPQIQQRLQDTVIIAHNAPFDMSFLHTEYSIARATFEPGPILDTLLLARRQYTFTSNSLGSIAETLNISTPHAHRALGDVLTTFAIFRHFAGDLARQHRPLVNDWLHMQGGIAWCSQPGSTLPADHPLHIAISQSRRVHITYRAGTGQITRRIIKPLTISGDFLLAYCELKKEQRTFRLDRIINITVLEL